MTELTHGEKLKLAGIKRYGSEEAWRKAKAEAGRKGGVKTGASKRRGDREYYSKIGKLGVEAKHEKDTKM